MQDTSERNGFFGLRFETRRPDEDKHVLPAQNLISALEGLQRTVHLVAMMQQGREVRSRARVTRDIEEHFQLLCAPTQVGSFYQPTFIADANPGLLAVTAIEDVTETTEGLLAAITQGDEAAFRKKVADSAYRAPLIASLERMFKDQGHYALEIYDSRGAVIANSIAAIATLDSLRQSRLWPDTSAIVTGYFNKIDFKERKLSLLLPGSQRLISCIYEEDIEPVLLANARDLIQVVGTIELDEHGVPLRITDVQEVHPVDTSDIDIIDLLPEYLKSVSRNNLHVSVDLSEDKQTYIASLDELGIDQAAYTRDDLMEGLRAEMSFLWTSIALEKDENLSPKAISLKVQLRNYFKEISE